MNILKKMNYAARAKLLFELLPADIPAFIEFTKNFAEYIRTAPAILQENWDMPFVSFNMWVGLADDVANNINTNGARLYKSSRFFSDNLFDGYTALFSVHCLQQFVQTQELKEHRFKTAVALFF